ncbi:MAG: hypothetical protein ACI4PY_10360 [Akkermansia muciniphila]
MVTACRRWWRGVLAWGRWYTCGAYDLRRRGVHLRGPCGGLPALRAMVAGIPEWVAGHACAGVHRRPLWCDCPAVAVMVTACRRCGGVYLCGGGAPAGAYDLRRRGWCACGACGAIACPACYGEGVPVAVAGYACGVVVCLWGV